MALTYRQNEILEYLKKSKYAKINELAEKLFVSDATIRRELRELKKLGLLDRNHGGAVIVDSANEIALHIRYERDPKDKRETANVALPKLPDFNTVFFDNSSTAYIIAQMMDLKYKTVVTNGISLATDLCKRENVNVIMPGGNLLSNTNSLTGAFATKCIADIHFGLVLCSCAAITADGAFENSIEQAELKRVALSNGTNRILLVDKNKFKNTASFRTLPLKSYNAIFTNADDETLEQFAGLRGVHIINK